MEGKGEIGGEGAVSESDLEKENSEKKIQVKKKGKIEKLKIEIKN
jgi:hypothetical protein